MTTTTIPDAAAGEVDLTEPIVLVSCDGHAGPPLNVMREYCPAELLEDYDAFASDFGPKFDIWAEVRRMLADMPDQEEAALREHELDRNLQTAGHYDMAARRADLDEEGIAAEVIYHSSQNAQPIPFVVGGSLFFQPTRGDLDRATAGFHIYNEWLADACSTAPERHIGVVHVPAWDIDACVREVEWARERGLRSVNLPTMRAGITVFDDPAWEPFWSACESLGVTLNTHVGGAGWDVQFTGNHATALLLVDKSGWLSRRALPVMIFSGVFDRHPNLKFALTEQNGDWWTATMREYDSAYLSHRWQLKEQMSRKPSEYCASSVFLGASYMAPFEAQLALEGDYVQNVMWGADYPHAEGTFQYKERADDPCITHLALRNTFADVDARSTRSMVSDNAIRCYDLDLDALRPIARRINSPTLEELSTRPDEIPPFTACRAFRELGPWG